MTLEELDKRLRALNSFENDIQNVDQWEMRLRFSNEVEERHWRINNEKLMLKDEEIAIRKHDRFIDFSEHSHDYLEMMFIYSGQIKHVVDGEIIILNKGDVLMMDMNTSHSIVAAGADDIGINILLKREFFDTFFLNQIAYNDKMTSFIVNAIYNRDNNHRHLYFKAGSNNKIWKTVTDILIEYFDKRNGMETAIRAYMLILFNELIRNYDRYLDQQMVSKVEASVASELMAYIDKHYMDITLKSMAKVFNYNPDYLGKQIKKMTGQTMKNLVRKRRLKEACKLLRNTTMSVTEVLEVINYSNTSYFYKQFKEEYDMTPDEYRNKE